MSVQPPPDEHGSLKGIAAVEVAGQTLWRAWQRHPPEGDERREPWWFNAVDPSAREYGGRFDLEADQGGTMHTAAVAALAVLEHMQFEVQHVAEEELRSRRLARITPPEEALAAADLRDISISAIVTNAVWAGDEAKPDSQRWARAFRRDGWWAVAAPSKYSAGGDPPSVALFDPEPGDHAPSVGGDWSYQELPADDPDLRRELDRRGMTVLGPAKLRVIDL